MPLPLQEVIGKKVWRCLAGYTLADAKRQVLVFLEETDDLIRQAEGKEPLRTPEQVIYSFKVEDIQAGLADGIGAEDIFTRATDEEHNQLQSLLEARAKGTALEPRTAVELLEAAKRLKDPAATTCIQWGRYLNDMLKLTNREYITLVTRQDALIYREHLLKINSPSTAKMRLLALSSLFSVAVEEQWIGTNPFETLSKRIRVKAKPKEVVGLTDADALVLLGKLPKHHTLLYHLLRWTGTHASESAGIRYKDIDLDNQVIHIVSWELRQLKNPYRIRDLPIHKELLAILKRDLGKQPKDELVFPWAYNEKRARWGEGLAWRKRIGVTPKATRDWCASCLRQADVNERTIGAILGHSPSSQTGGYGGVDIDTKRKAIALLR